MPHEAKQKQCSADGDPQFIQKIVSQAQLFQLTHPGMVPRAQLKSTNNKEPLLQDGLVNHSPEEDPLSGRQSCQECDVSHMCDRLAGQSTVSENNEVDRMGNENIRQGIQTSIYHDVPTIHKPYARPFTFYWRKYLDCWRKEQQELFLWVLINIFTF